MRTSLRTLFFVGVFVGSGFQSVRGVPHFLQNLNFWCTRRLCPERASVEPQRSRWASLKAPHKGMLREQKSRLISVEETKNPGQKNDSSYVTPVKKNVGFSESSFVSPKKESIRKFEMPNVQGSSAKKKSASKRKRAAERDARAEDNLKKLIANEALKSTYLGKMAAQLQCFQEARELKFWHYNHSVGIVQAVCSYMKDFLQFSDQAEEGNDLFLKIMEKMFALLYERVSVNSDLQNEITDSLLEQFREKVPESHSRFRLVLELRLEQRRMLRERN